jgi:alginate O-acetyltransferase complex protein AlgI
MIFQSLDFLVFLAIAFAVHWSLPGPHRKWFLLGASYVFFGYVHPWFLLLLWYVTLLVYGCGLAIERYEKHRKAFMILGILGCLAMLGVFKYFHFFVDNFVAAVNLLGIPATVPAFKVLLPAGISFFAFQGISYVVDVYRGQLKARTSLLDVALFKAFFPQLVAGPIERGTHLLPQVEHPRVLRLELVVDGFFLIVWGFFKKLVIADNVAVIANKVFVLEEPGFPVLWAGVFAFCIQIFADFSAYTDIARGTGKLFGINLIENFRHPYLAQTPADFWRRWHISLSTWFRDYVYIPLGGNRSGKLFEARNIMITFLLSGLWHGASWNFVLWGAYWGLLIVIYRHVGDRVPDRVAALPGLAALRVLLMFVLINIGWLLFRETDLHYLMRYLTLSPVDATTLEWQAGAYFSSLVALYSLPIVVHMWLDRDEKSARAEEPRAFYNSLAMRTVTAAGLFGATLLLRTATSADFIYFQF